MSAFKTDGTFSSAALDGSWRKSFPIPGDNVSFIVEQDFQVEFASFTPLALNTAHATFSTAYLVSESPLEDLGGGIARWTRTYAQIPATRDEYETYATKFPGLKGVTNPPYDQYWIASDDGRDPFTETVNSRLRYEYFLCADGQDYETPEAIPVLLAQQFTLVSNQNVKVDYLLPEGLYWSDSLPSKEDWLELIDDEDEFIAEDSRIERWLGNIYVRITRYVKAK